MSKHRPGTRGYLKGNLKMFFVGAEDFTGEEGGYAILPSGGSGVPGLPDGIKPPMD